MRVLVFAVLAVVGASACRVEHVAPGDESRQELSGAVEVQRTESGFLVTNGTERPVAYHVWPRGYLGLLAPCADPGPSCLRLAPGASVSVALSEIEGLVPETREITVHWWHVEPDEGGVFRAGDMHEIHLAI